MKNTIRVLVGLACASLAHLAVADPSPGETTVLGPLTGVGAKLHPRNVAPIPIAYYGTDLGYTYEHRGQLHFLFGDTAATEQGAPIEPSTKGAHDDSFATLDLAEIGRAHV